MNVCGYVALHTMCPNMPICIESCMQVCACTLPMQGVCAYSMGNLLFRCMHVMLVCVCACHVLMFALFARVFVCKVVWQGLIVLFFAG